MKPIICLMVLCLCGAPALANNIQVSNAAIASKNGTEMYAMVRFDISWDNSWRLSTAPNNWDAAWVFVKYRTSGGEWKHAWLNNNGHAALAGSAIDVGLLNPGSAFNATTNPGLGVFIYRSADGTGTFSLSGVELRWNFGDNGVTNDDVVDVLVYAVEMVYVPGGSFYVGSGGTEFGSFTKGYYGDKVISVTIMNGGSEYASPPTVTFSGGGGTNAAGTAVLGELPPNVGKVIRVDMTNQGSGYTSRPTVTFSDGGTTVAQGIAILGGGSPIPFLISNENAITIGQGANDLWSTAYDAKQDEILGAGFPKGTKGFYSMKYEITQQQYVDFLSSLSRTKQEFRFPSVTSYKAGDYMTNMHDPSLNPPTIASDVPKCRNGIRFMSDPGSPHPRVFGNDLNNNGIAGEANDGQNIACNFLNWSDLAAILDWMGLRPMTELEFEKACRGPDAPVTNEYAWGTATAVQATDVGGEQGGSTEVVRLPLNANAAFGNHAGVQGTLRTGIFATSLTNRSSAGASYYGIMELSGNVREWIVNANLTYEPNEEEWPIGGRDYTGKHGNGELNFSGAADVDGWPTGIHSIGLRGGDWANTAQFLRVSDRTTASMPNSNHSTFGGRGVRTAP